MTTTKKHSKSPKYIVGIGASAGGLEALQDLLSNLPVDTGAAYIIVQHLSPDFKSMMLELLSRHTKMKIENALDKVAVQANTVYLLPPKKSIKIQNAVLQLSDKVKDPISALSIDMFLATLATDLQQKAIAVILSGTGSDGSKGVKYVKEQGGIVIVQEPKSAKFDGMPNSAINTGHVDFILNPESIANQLTRLLTHELDTPISENFVNELNDKENALKEIFALIKVKKEIDFSNYKPTTISRRIERRMSIKQISSLHDYLNLLIVDKIETESLVSELLIGVTHFFRDQKAFDIIEHDVLPKLIKQKQKQKQDTKSLRVWVAACSTGEEAYSLAILLSEALSKVQTPVDFKVFATDLNPEAISTASLGMYNQESMTDMRPTFLSKYFIKLPEGNYQVKKELRNSVVFAVHNLIVDPPFSNIDLVTCRNLLIYFKQNAQSQALSSLHFSLKKDGFLFLGSSENLGTLQPHFTVINERQKVYQKTSSVRLPSSASNPRTSSGSKGVNTIPSINSLMRHYKENVVTIGTAQFANDALINRYAPPSILLNQEFQAIHVYGDTSAFVKRLPPGKFSSDIADLINDDINVAVKAGLQKAKQTKQEVYYTDLFTKIDEKALALNLRVLQVKEHELQDSPIFYWVIFETSDKKEITQIEAVSFDVNEQSKQQIADLELQLKYSKEHLQVTIEELETTNEELQSANEELMSANEELQSTNEELQSVNEELHTVNSEYQDKIMEISQANSDLDEVLSLSQIGIIFVDENLVIRRYTQAAKKYINLVDADINRPLHHISMNIQYENLLGDVAKVFNTLTPIENDIILDNKRVLRVYINAYKESETSEKISVAITFSDISSIIYTEKGMEVAYSELRNSVNNALDLLDPQGFDKTLNILIVDDSSLYLDLLSELINRIESFECKIYRASDSEEVLKILKANTIDVCVCDYYLQDETALNIIEIIKENNFVLPTIVVTAALNEDIKPILLAHGSLDLIDKAELTPEYLDKSIRYAIRRFDIDKRFDELISNSTVN